jgi:DNA-binding SARP family transcriptional activator
MRIDIALLGRFEVRVDGRPIQPGRFSRRHSAALIKLLAMTPALGLHREQVIDALWPDLTLDEAAPRLHKAAHFARKAFGYREAIVLTGEGVRLCPNDEVYVDARDFEGMAERALADSDVAAAKAALAAYGGELLPLDVYESWAQPSRERLDHLHRQLLRQVGDWHQILRADPADEQAHLALMRRYAEYGDRTAALRQFDSLDHVMRHALGVEPSEQALALRQQVLTVDTAAYPVVEAEGAGPHTRLMDVLADLRRRLCTQLDELGNAYRDEIDRALAGTGLGRGVVERTEMAQLSSASGSCCG